MVGRRETWERLRRVRPRLMDARGVDKVHQIVPGIHFAPPRRANLATNVIAFFVLTYIVLGGLRATMYNEVLQFALIVIFA